MLNTEHKVHYILHEFNVKVIRALLTYLLTLRNCYTNNLKTPK